MKHAMKHFDLTSMRRLAGACGLIILLTLAPAVVAQQAAPVQGSNHPSAAPAAVAPAATSQAASATPKTALASKPAAEKETAAPNTANNQGIKIHGHWVLQVKNADGTLGARREFDNSLVTGGNSTSGDQVLAALLSGNGSSGGLGIAFISSSTKTTAGLDVSSFCLGTGSTEPGEPSVPAGINCYGLTSSTNLLGSSNGQNALYQFTYNVGQTTGLTSLVSFSPTVNIVLSGNFTVSSSYSGLLSNGIFGVGTYASICSTFGGATYASGWRLAGSNLAFQQSSVAPSGCVLSGSAPANFVGALTYTDVPGGAIPVTVGQVVQVTVTLTFS
jgi:hypothetical protein